MPSLDAAWDPCFFVSFPEAAVVPLWGEQILITVNHSTVNPVDIPYVTVSRGKELKEKNKRRNRKKQGKKQESLQK